MSAFCYPLGASLSSRSLSPSLGHPPSYTIIYIRFRELSSLSFLHEPQSCSEPTNYYSNNLQTRLVHVYHSMKELDFEMRKAKKLLWGTRIIVSLVARPQSTANPGLNLLQWQSPHRSKKGWIEGKGNGLDRSKKTMIWIVIKKQ